MDAENRDNVTFADVAAAQDGPEREALIRELVDALTQDEKIRLMAGVDPLSWMRPYGTALFPAGGVERLGIPKIKFTDGPRGVMLNHSTCFPVNMARGATWDPDLEERIGKAMGAEARAQGANLSGAVCINVLRHPAWGRAQETFGEDPFHIGTMGAALTRGLQNYVMACAKHFAANSIENARFRVDVRMDDRTLHEVYLPHFKMCIDAGAASVMGAYNRLNGPHCCHSAPLLRTILKDMWGFDGFVVSDFMFGLRGADAAAAGLDIEMPWRLFFGRLLKRDLSSGKVRPEHLDDAAARIIRQLARFEGEPSEGGPQKAPPPKTVVACKEHTDLALEAAQKSLVLLKNEEHALPLSREHVRTLAVFGKLAQKANLGDTGSSITKPPYKVSPLEGLRKLAGDDVEIWYSRGRNLSRACAMAAKADAALVVAGLTHKDEGEYVPLYNPVGDRTDLGLSRRQERLILAVAEENPRCIVALQGGAAITVDNWVDHVPALLMSWYPGMEGGTALARALFGDAEPGGRLPITFHREISHLPPFDRWARSIDYEYFHGYRLFDRNEDEPMFAFGFGLGYTTFEYANLEISNKKIGADGQVTVSADVTNTGDAAGDDVAQLYVGCEGSAVERPVRELKGFRRVSLAPGETQRVSYTLRARDLAYFDSDTQDWIVEPLTARVFVGPSSREQDLALQGMFEVEG